MLSVSSSTVRLAFGYSYNRVEVWDIFTGTHTKTRVVAGRCAERSLLYTMEFGNNSGGAATSDGRSNGNGIDSLVVVAGTVFSQILLWYLYFSFFFLV